MSGMRTAVAALAATVVAGSVLATAQQMPARAGAAAQGGTGQTPSALPLSQTVRERGSSVTGSFEGWYHGKDGNDYAFLGYFNRNTKQELDVPAGPNNRIEPGGPDQGQPTHFQTGRQRGVFALKLPKDLGTKKLVWTIVSNGFTNAITIHTQADYIIEPYMNSTTKAVPPVLKFEPGGTSFAGPPVGIAATYTASVGSPLTLTTYIAGEPGRGPGGGGGGAGRGGRGTAGAPAGTSSEPSASSPVASPDAAAAPAGAQGRGGRGGRGAGAAAAGAAAAGGGFPGGRGGGGATWTKYRGPGTVTFANIPRPAGEAAADGKSQASATFDTAGDYTLRVQAGAPNGEQCCWTNAHVKVTVK